MDWTVDTTPKHRCKHGAFACLRCGIGVESVVHTTREGRGKVARLRRKTTNDRLKRRKHDLHG